MAKIFLICTLLSIASCVVADVQDGAVKVRLAKGYDVYKGDSLKHSVRLNYYDDGKIKQYTTIDEGDTTSTYDVTYVDYKDSISQSKETSIQIHCVYSAPNYHNDDKKYIIKNDTITVTYGSSDYEFQDRYILKDNYEKISLSYEDDGILEVVHTFNEFGISSSWAGDSFSSYSEITIPRKAYRWAPEVPYMGIGKYALLANFSDINYGNFEVLIPILEQRRIGTPTYIDEVLDDDNDKIEVEKIHKSPFPNYFIGHAESGVEVDMALSQQYFIGLWTSEGENPQSAPGILYNIPFEGGIYNRDALSWFEFDTIRYSVPKNFGIYKIDYKFDDTNSLTELSTSIEVEDSIVVLERAPAYRTLGWNNIINEKDGTVEYNGKIMPLKQALALNKKETNKRIAEAKKKLKEMGIVTQEDFNSRINKENGYRLRRTLWDLEKELNCEPETIYHHKGEIKKWRLEKLGERTLTRTIKIIY